MIDDSLASFGEEVSLASAVYEDLNVIDIVFALLAISTAFGMVNRAGGNEPSPEPIALEERSRRAA